MGRNNSLKRRPPSREELRRYLIVCEGEVTERRYFDELRILEKIPIEIKFIAGATPKTLVEWAVREKRALRREKDKIYEEIWVVFDVDTHPFLAEARQQANDNSINIAISNPCFELWALLHFQDQSAYIKCADVRDLCKTYMPGYDKRLPCSKLLPLYEEALHRAQVLQKAHEANDKVGANPSTGVFDLVRSILAQRRSYG